MGLKEFQLNLMLLLSGICGTIAFFVTITKTIERRRKRTLLSMELGAMALLMSDRFAYIYRGNESTTGVYMTHISNYLVFFLTLFLLWSFNSYLKDLYEEQGNVKAIPKRLKLVDYLFVVGELLLIISQFTGFYYTFDETNTYHRSSGYFVCYIIPMLIFVSQLSVIIQYYKKLHKNMRLALILFATLPLIASIIQLFVYGLSLTNITLVGMIVLLYIFTLIDANETVERAKNIEIKALKDEQEHFRAIFVQTAEALATAIDAKDRYTHGHSRRVAEYSEKIARISGMDNKSCEEVYFAALLHDVGKIGIPDEIINKVGRLTDEEFAEIKKHPFIGKQILSSISRSPYLSVGANYHHERYDGKGYPEGLKGDDIPQIARIIAVADAYDAMTSKRSYRDPIPQQIVREEFVKGLETQFDPVYTKIMLHLIDLDSEYRMKERQDITEHKRNQDYYFTAYRASFTDSVHINEYPLRIHFRSKGDDAELSADPTPSLIIFDSLDSNVHDNDSKNKDMLYFEYCEVRVDGQVINAGAREIKTTIDKHYETGSLNWKEIFRNGIDYNIEAVRYKDHLRLRINCKYQSMVVIAALPDSTRFSYMCLTGQNCTINGIKTSKAAEPIGKDEIPRIAEEVSYINVPDGDIPNVQIDGWRSSSTEAIKIEDKVEIIFHTLSLPTARLVWHCPFVVIFSADDNKVDGKNYREFALIRMDGESWESDKQAKNFITVNKNEAFQNWDTWKKNNKAGIDCKITIRRKGNTVTTTTESAGITTNNITTIKDNVPELYAALTGDQCALTNIRISHSRFNPINELNPVKRLSGDKQI